MDTTHSVLPKSGPRAQNIKSAPDALSMAEKLAWERKTRLDDLGTAQNESGSKKHETGPDALRTA
jgi:hypothetical protein